jgi:hypothetical protein
MIVIKIQSRQIQGHSKIIKCFLILMVQKTFKLTGCSCDQWINSDVIFKSPVKKTKHPPYLTPGKNNVINIWQCMYSSKHYSPRYQDMVTCTLRSLCPVTKLSVSTGCVLWPVWRLWREGTFLLTQGIEPRSTSLHRISKTSFLNCLFTAVSTFSLPVL